MAKGNTMLSLLKFWHNKHVKYIHLRTSEEKEKSTYFGVQSIIESIVGLVIIGLSIWGVIALIQHLTIELGFFQILGIIVLAGVILSALVYCPIQALVCLIYQLIINKKAIGWVALGIWIATIIGYCVEIALLVKFIL